MMYFDKVVSTIGEGEQGVVVITIGEGEQGVVNE